jgi:hypothetical protein
MNIKFIPRIKMVDFSSGAMAFHPTDKLTIYYTLPHFYGKASSLLSYPATTIAEHSVQGPVL